MAHVRTIRRPLAALTTLSALLAAAACGAHGAAAGGGHAVADDAAVARARADSARFPYTEADVDFMTGMIGHHSQAILMAGWAPTHEASPAVQRLAARIVNAQRDEITLMRAWLRDRGRPVPETAPTGIRMTMGGMTHVMPMPGMLDAEQLKRLDAARGPAFDNLFLTFMIQHHRGAVAMVSSLFASHGAGQDVTVFKFASDVSVDQTTEINRMLDMLLSLGGPPRSP